MIKRIHLQRLRQMYRSAGWPCQDIVEIELLAAGLLERVPHPGQPQGPETLRLTDAGVQALAESVSRNREALSAHEALVQQVAEWLHAQDRIVYLGLTLLAKPGEDWQHRRPDVFSIRKTTREDYLEPIIHEIKVRRADLLADLKDPEKHESYLAAAGQCTYVLAEGVGTPEEIPESCGVMLVREGTLTTARPAPRRAEGKVSFSTWMSLARAVPYRGDTAPTQGEM